jgi:hypothetical protein
LIADWVLAMVDVKFGAVQGLKRQSGSQRYSGPGSVPISSESQREILGAALRRQPERLLSG